MWLKDLLDIQMPDARKRVDSRVRDELEVFRDMLPIARNMDESNSIYAQYNQKKYQLMTKEIKREISEWQFRPVTRNNMEWQWAYLPADDKRLVVGAIHMMMSVAKRDASRGEWSAEFAEMFELVARLVDASQRLTKEIIARRAGDKKRHLLPKGDARQWVRSVVEGEEKKDLS